MKNVLVTGASGFIGGRLIRRVLRLGCRVRAFSRSAYVPMDSGAVEVISGDVRDSELISRVVTGIDTVFHLAARTHEIQEVQEDWESYSSINIEGTRNLLRGSIEAGVERFVFFSSVKVFGESTSGMVDESFVPNPQSAYGKSKLAAETLLFDYGRKSKLHTVCLRLPMVFGETNRGNLYRMISAIDRGLFPPFPRLENRRSMVHVDDVVEAAIMSAMAPDAKGKVYVVSDGNAYSTRCLYEWISASLGRPVPSWRVPITALRLIAVAGDVIGRLRGHRFIFDSDALEKLSGTAWYSSERISTELGFTASMPLKRVLPAIIQNYHSKA